MISKHDTGNRVIAWYDREPGVCGVGQTYALAVGDLKSRETNERTVGGIWISTIGKSTIVRCGDQVGIGSNVNTALKSMLAIPADDPVEFSSSGSRWHVAEPGFSATALTPGDAYRFLQRERKNRRSKYLGFQDGSVKVVWYLAEPEIRGTGKTEQDAIEDLKGRETDQRDVGGVCVSEIGKSTIVRCGGSMGVGPTYNCAMKSMVGASAADNIGFTFNDGKWVACDVDRSVAGDNPKAAYEKLLEMRKPEPVLTAQLSSGEFTAWYEAEPSIHGVGKTREAARAYLRSKEIAREALGDVQVSTIGKTTIVRSEGAIGFGSDGKTALRNLVGLLSDSETTVLWGTDGLWWATSKTARVSGPTPKAAYQALLRAETGTLKIKVIGSDGQAKQIVEAVNKVVTTTNPVFSTCFIPGVLGEKKHPMMGGIPRHIKTQNDSRLKVAWYAKEPSVCGVGETIALAIKDLRSRESHVDRQGSVDVSSIGALIVVRTMKGEGIGTNVNEAIKDMLGASDHVRFEFKDGRWLAVNREGFVGSSRDPYWALRRLNEISKPSRPELSDADEKDARYEADLKGARGEIDALRQVIEKGKNEYDLLKAAYDKRLVVPAGKDVLTRAILSLGVSIHTTYREPSREWSVTIDGSTGCSGSEKAALSLAVSCWVNQSKGRLRDLISAILEVGDG